MDETIYHCRVCDSSFPDAPEVTRAVGGIFVACPICAVVTACTDADCERLLMERAFDLEVL
jgi:hypothetical protein